MDALLRDLRFTLRNMAKQPGLAAVIAVSLALGIGANTAIYGLIRTVLLKSLPVQDPERLVVLYWGADEWPKDLVQSGSGGPRGTRWRSSSRSLAFPYFRQIADHNTVLASVFAFAPLGPSRQNVTLAAGGVGERVDGEIVSGEFFSGLGASAAAGRLIGPGDERDQAHVAVLSHAYWVRRFAADPSILGSNVTINNVSFSVIGVTRAGFFGVQPGRVPDVWVPMMDAPELAPWGYRPADASSLLTMQKYWWVQVMGRLKDGVDGGQAAATLDTMFQSFVREALPRVNRDHPPHIGLEPGGAGLDSARSAYEQPLLLLMGMVGLVLMIACANVAVLLLARSTSRRRELAMRLALGAGRGRLVRQLLTECLLMAVIGGALGLLCAGWTSRSLLHLLPAEQRPIIGSQIDGGVLAFAALVSVATALVFGIVPAIVGTRVDVLPALKQSSTAAVVSDQPAYRLWSSTFVVVQMALSLVLLVGAALFIQTMNHLQAQALGVDRDRLLVFGIDASQNGYTGERLAAVYGQVLRELQALPGVQSATAARLRLFSGWVSNGPITIPGEQRKTTGMSITSNAVGPAFATTTGLQLLAGRQIDWPDLDGKRRVTVVNEAMARYFFDSTNVVGRRFSFGETADPEHEYEIVGVVSNAKYSQVRGDFPKTAYLPYTANRSALRELHMMVRTARDPLTLAATARSAVQRVNPDIAIVDLDSMAHQVADSLWKERLMARLTAAFGALALALACVGLYGTIAYGVGRRRAEIAVRVALGARRGQILWMIQRQALAFAAAGVAAGIPLALWAWRFVSSQLFGLTPGDPIALGAAAVVLSCVAALAGYVPARRAMLVEPAIALKQE